MCIFVPPLTPGCQRRQRAVCGGFLALEVPGGGPLTDGCGGVSGGRCEIRTHGAVADTPDFKSGALDRSANLPIWLQANADSTGKPIETLAVSASLTAATKLVAHLPYGF